jgi:hypothetical protein
MAAGTTSFALPLHVWQRETIPRAQMTNEWTFLQSDYLYKQIIADALIDSELSPEVAVVRSILSVSGDSS